MPPPQSALSARKIFQLRQHSVKSRPRQRAIFSRPEGLTIPLIAGFRMTASRVLLTAHPAASTRCGFQQHAWQGGNPPLHPPRIGSQESMPRRNRAMMACRADRRQASAFSSVHRHPRGQRPGLALHHRRRRDRRGRLWSHGQRQDERDGQAPGLGLSRQRRRNGRHRVMRESFRTRAVAGMGQGGRARA